jgi:WD40 repeat protein
MATRTRSAILAAGLLAACAHDAPFRPRVDAPQGPYDPTPPVRLTRNPLGDRFPAWRADGTGILYSTDRADRFDHDRCLALLPAAGGAIERYICYQGGGSDDSVDAFESVAAATNGALAFTHASAFIGFSWPIAPYFRRLVKLAGGPAQELLDIPYLAPSGRTHQALSHLAWLGTDTLVYVGADIAYPRPCPGCVDTLQWGIEIALLDLSGAAPVVSIVPGTGGASAVAVGAGDTIYYTLNGDSRVLRRALASGDTATVHDFGAAGIARDPAVRGRRLVAVVGGDVIYEVDAVLGPVQRDNGGILHVVDLATGGDSVPVNPADRYRRPALSPDGKHVALEGVAGRTTDLWLVTLP